MWFVALIKLLLMLSEQVWVHEEWTRWYCSLWFLCFKNIFEEADKNVWLFCRSSPVREMSQSPTMVPLSSSKCNWFTLLPKWYFQIWLDYILQNFIAYSFFILSVGRIVKSPRCWSWRWYYQCCSSRWKSLGGCSEACRERHPPNSHQWIIPKGLNPIFLLDLL